MNKQLLWATFQVNGHKETFPLGSLRFGVAEEIKEACNNLIHLRGSFYQYRHPVSLVEVIDHPPPEEF